MSEVTDESKTTFLEALKSGPKDAREMMAAFGFEEMTRDNKKVVRDTGRTLLDEGKVSHVLPLCGKLQLTPIIAGTE